MNSYRVPLPFDVPDLELKAGDRCTVDLSAAPRNGDIVIVQDAGIRRMTDAVAAGRVVAVLTDFNRDLKPLATRQVHGSA